MVGAEEGPQELVRMLELSGAGGRNAWGCRLAPGPAWRPSRWCILPPGGEGAHGTGTDLFSPRGVGLRMGQAHPVASAVE